MKNNITWNDVYNNQPMKDNLINFLPIEQDNMIFYSPEKCEESLDIASLVSQREKNGCDYIVIACDNKYALKMFAGNRNCGEQYFDAIINSNAEKSTYARTEIERQLVECGISDYKFYYPYPNYQLPLAIYSDEYLPKRGELTNNLRNFGVDRVMLFDENQAWDNVIEDGLFTTFTNSVLVVIGDTIEWPQGKVIFSKFSNDRNPAYNIRTDIVRDGESQSVIKRSVGTDAIEHIHSLENHYKQLQTAYPTLAFNKCKLDGDTARLEYLEGETLDELLIRELQNSNTKDVLDTLKKYVEVVSNSQNENVIDVDLIFKNIIVVNGTWNVIDYEWTFDKAHMTDLFVEKLSIPFVIYRSFYYFIEDNKIEQSVANKIYSLIDLDEAKIKEYQELENEFQFFVSRGHTPLNELYHQYGGPVYPVIDSLYERLQQEKIQIYTVSCEDSSTLYTNWYDKIMEDQHQISIEVPENITRVDIVMGHCNMIVEILEASIAENNILETIVIDGYNVYNKMYLYAGSNNTPILQIPTKGKSGMLNLCLLIHNEGDNSSVAFATLNHYLQLKDHEHSIKGKIKSVIKKR